MPQFHFFFYFLTKMHSFCIALVKYRPNKYLITNKLTQSIFSCEFWIHFEIHLNRKPTSIWKNEKFMLLKFLPCYGWIGRVSGALIGRITWPTQVSLLFSMWLANWKEHCTAIIALKGEAITVIHVSCTDHDYSTLPPPSPFTFNSLVNFIGVQYPKALGLADVIDSNE